MSVTCEFAQLPDKVLVWVIISCHDNLWFLEKRGKSSTYSMYYKCLWNNNGNLQI